MCLLSKNVVLAWQVLLGCLLGGMVSPFRKGKEMRSVFVEGKSWFDKTGGNSYFSARIWIDGKVAIVLPFQYGYGNQFEYEAVRALSLNGHLPEGFDVSASLWRLREFGIDAYSTISEAKKADVVRFGKAEVFA